MRGCAAVVFVVSCLVSTPLADAGNEPWAQGLSAADQERATLLVSEGNALVTQSPSAALEKYQAALQIWDHPLFHFRMTITLMQLGRNDDARAQLHAALRFGAAPFSQDDYAQITGYQQMLDDQHRAHEDVIEERRFATWIPWTTIGIGAVGLVAGIGLQLIAKSDENTFDQQFASECAVNGCDIVHPTTPQDLELKALHDRAVLRDDLATGALLVSGAVAITGIVLAVLNRPHAVRVDAHAATGGATAGLGWDF